MTDPIRYEDYRTKFNPTATTFANLFIGALGNAANESLHYWLEEVKKQIVGNIPDSELVANGFKSFKIFAKSGLGGNAIGAAVQAIEVRTYQDGTTSLAFNGNTFDLLNIVTGAAGEYTIGAALTEIAVAAGVALEFWPLLAIAVGSGLIYNFVYSPIYNFLTWVSNTGDVNVNLFDASGVNVARMIYPEGKLVPTLPELFVKSLIQNDSYDLTGQKIVVSGGQYNGAEFQIGSAPYQQISSALGISMTQLFSYITDDGAGHVVDNQSYRANNKALSEFFYYSTNTNSNLGIKDKNSC